MIAKEITISTRPAMPPPIANGRTALFFPDLGGRVICTFRNAEPDKDPINERTCDISKHEPFEASVLYPNRAALQ
jgi:hypothetical protein